MNKIRFNLYSVIGIVYIAVMTSRAWDSVGEYPTMCGEPYGWTLPLTMFVIITFPFILGGIAERENK
jgi:hypothetical protein